MSIETGIYKILSTAASLSGVSISFGIAPPINSTTSTPNPQDYIVFYRNTTTPNDTKTGNAIGTVNLLSGKSTLDVCTIQINCFSVRSTSSSTLANNVRNALDRVSGTFSGVVIQSIQFTNEVSMFEFNESYNTKGLYQYTLY